MASSMGPGKMVTDGLVLHLDAGNNKSYPGSGTSWNNLISARPTGSLLNGASFNNTSNGLITFDGTNDYVNLGNDGVLKPANPTISVWVNPGVTGSRLQCIFDGGYANSNVGYLLYTNSPSNFQFWVRNTLGNNTQGSGVRTVTSATTFNTASWYNVTGVYDGTNAIIYVNGILESAGSIPPPIAYTTSNVAIGEYVSLLGANTFTGSIGQVLLYNRALSANEVFQNYEATRERFNRPTIVTDDDARNFLNSANISDETQQRAVNDLVVDLKNVGLWGKMKAIYPFVGGTAASHKWNLKDPRDLDAAFRLTFYGGWTHSSTGADPNGTTAYADTFITPSTHLSLNNTHISYYSRENTVGLSNEQAMMGSSANPSYTNRIYIDLFFTGGVTGMYGTVNSTTNSSYSIIDWINYTETDSRAHYLMSRTSATSFSSYRNGISKGTNSTVVTSGLNSFKIYLGAYNLYGTAAIFAYNQCGFASIGDGLTSTESTNFYNIVQKYQTTLGRQV